MCECLSYIGCFLYEIFYHTGSVLSNERMNKMNTVCIVEQPLDIKEWQGQRVITFKDIDRVHQRPEGTAKRNFQMNKKHFIENVDFFKAKPAVDKKNEIRTFNIPIRGLTLLTESGYLMLAKSLTDDLAWDVQRALVNNYFRVSQPVQQQLPLEDKPKRKTWNGNPVMTVEDLAALMHCTRDIVHFWVKKSNVVYTILEGINLAEYKQENKLQSSSKRLMVFPEVSVETLLKSNETYKEHADFLHEYFMPEHALSNEDMRFAVKQADLLLCIARDIKDPVVKEMNLKAVTALLINIGLWNDKHAGFNGVSAEWDINSLEGWNKIRAFHNAQRYWKW